MKPIGTRHWRWGAWLGPALAATVLTSLSAAGADRRVLCEEFTDVN
jgi:hypothetical protein